jgi:restriction system protein
VARRRYRGRKDEFNFVAGLVILAAFLIHKVDFGKVLYILFLVCLVGAILAGIYYLFRKDEPALEALPSRHPVPRPRAGNTPQAVNDLVASAQSFEPDGDEFTMGPLHVECRPEWSAEVLTSLEWKRFETVCAEYFRMTGYIPKETRIGADGGVDIWVYKPGSEKPFGIVQCKAWTTYKVGIKPVRELFGVMAAEGVANGMFITSGEFTSEALAFAVGKKLRLISRKMFLEFIGKLSAEKQEELLALALEGDYRTPTCPQCGIKMTLREGKGSRRDFWGCLRYPRCRATLVYKVEAA